MLQRFTIGLLTCSLAQSVSVPTIAQTRPTPACKNSIAVSQFAPPTYLTGSVRGISLQQAEQRAAIAIEFLRANRPDRANQINETLRSRLELSASEMAVLRTIQNLEAGKNQAAIALFSELKRPEAYRRSISLQLERIPLQAKAAWILPAVDYFPEPDEDEMNYQQQWNLPTLKAEWMLLLAENYRTQGKATEAVKILDQARMLLNWNNNAEALQFVEAYRKAEQPEKARTILTPITAQLLGRIEAQPGETVRPRAIQNLIKAGHELALLKQSSEALPLLNQAEALIKSVDRSNVKPLQQSLVLAYAAAGQTTQALQIVQNLDSRDARESYVALAKQAAELGDSRSAQQFLQSIRDQWTASRASFDVVKLLTDAELFPAAYDIATSIADPQMRLEAMAKMIGDLSKQVSGFSKVTSLSIGADVSSFVQGTVLFRSQP
ncbi:tetratricopeptide repeat protein [Leptolyngbya sp. AN03gr2]|uniref:tetratricopeptide repeat protein n=1 Tax=Leptolyngbya sp. AN03gr2 TaxID=3423364 RepID=UPI003D31EBB0